MFAVPLVLACAPSAPPAPAPAPVPVAPAPVGVPPVLLALEPPQPVDRFRYEAEVSGMVTLLLEAGLGELGGVVVTVGERPAPPGAVRIAGAGRAERWMGRVAVGADPRALDVELELCAPAGNRCRSTSASATRDAPHLAMPALLGWASEVLGRPPSAGAVGQWALAPSADPYAVLVGGRAAAVWYGLLPPARPGLEGDKKADPVVRAVYIDPGLALSQWIIGRRHAAAGRWDEALPAFTAAREGRPFMPVLLADEAWAMAENGHADAAADAWDGLVELVPHDARFVLARAEALLDAGRLADARPALEDLSKRWPEDAGVAAARVALADASGEERGTDELLAHWQATAPTEPEPVRRRIHLRVRHGAYRDAWDLLPELRGRGAEAETTGLEMALGVAIGRWDEAAGAAERAGLPEVATRIRARAALERDAAAPVEALAPDPSAAARIVVGRRALADGKPALALARATEAERAWPWYPEALALARDAYTALGASSDAARAAARLAEIEPDAPTVLVPPGG